MRFSIVIATYNRAALLKDTLESLAAAARRAVGSDRRRQQLARRHARGRRGGGRRRFRCRCATSFEREQGRSAALNCGFRLAAGEIVVTTDDDVRVEPDWLNHIEFGLATKQCDYVGGRVMPMWESEPPRWMPRTNGRHVGGDRAARLRPGADPVRHARAARRQHGDAARGDRARRRLRPADRPQGRHAARPGSARVVHARPRRRPGRLLHPRRWSCATSSRPTG